MNSYNLLDVLSNGVTVEEADKSVHYVFEGIQIPMIQRDYAQGRAQESEVRKRFLKAIFDALQNKKELTLDFVYGSVSKVGDSDFFLPLDGQQRLTTLYLLHWYIGNRELESEELGLLREALLKFSYATRTTAREFCERLADIALDPSLLPSKQISDSAWFYQYYRQDPTVMSMLAMLDAIHERYTPGSQLYLGLQKIKFYILPLDGFNLSDELYIKMNARGKQLTDYENFKADLVSWLQAADNPYYDKFHSKVMLGTHAMPYHMAFAIKLDNGWTNMFWAYILKDGQSTAKVKDRDKQRDKGDKVIDPYFLRFWKRYLLNQYIVHSNHSIDSLEANPLFSSFYNEESYKYESFELYLEIVRGQNIIEKIDKILTGLQDHYNEIISSIAPSWASKEPWKPFSMVINQRQRLLLHSICIYLEHNMFSLKSFRRWMRVSWNLIIDPDIRSIPALVSVMKTLTKMGAGSGKIYDYLQTDEFDGILVAERSFLRAQLEEERDKAALIVEDDKWEMDLIAAERHPLLQGNVGFLLRDKPERKKFVHRTTLINVMCGSKGAKGNFNVNHRLFRALISKIADWDKLFRISFTDDIDNWQLLLRRDREIGEALRRYCDLADSATVLKQVKADAVGHSSIVQAGASAGNLKKARRIHGSLYRKKNLFAWMQEKKATELKYYDGRLFIRRPRSWYDWVMLDTWRNQIAMKLIERFEFTEEQRCGDSAFFWGFGLELTWSRPGLTISAWFDAVDTLHIGIQEGGLQLQPDILPEPVDPIEGWIDQQPYDYLKIRSDQAINDLIDEVSLSIFDTSNPNSLLSRYLTFPELADTIGKEQITD
jgi:hypothetical protein